MIKTVLLLLFLIACHDDAALVTAKRATSRGVNRGLQGNGKDNKAKNKDVVANMKKQGMKMTPPPTVSPSPTLFPTSTFIPTFSPTLTPTFTALPTITGFPTYDPTITRFPTFAPSFSPTARPTRNKPTKKNNNKNNQARLKQGRIFETRAAKSPPPTPVPSISPKAVESAGTDSPTFFPSLAPTITPVKKGKKGKHPKGKGKRLLELGARGLKKGGKGHRQKRAGNKGSTTPVQSRVAGPAPSSSPVGKDDGATTTSKTEDTGVTTADAPTEPPAPKGSKKRGGPKGESRQDPGMTSTITYWAPGKKGSPGVVEYDPATGKKGGASSGKTEDQGSASSETPVAVSTPAPQPVTAPTAPTTPTKTTKVLSPSEAPLTPTIGASISTPVAESPSAPGTAASPQFFATVGLPKISFKYTVFSGTTPTQQDYKDLSVVTAVLLDGVFYDYFLGSSGTQYYSTNIDSASPTTPFDVEFGASTHFLLPTLAPSPGQLATVLQQNFNAATYIALLKRLAVSNIFSTTTDVTIEIDPSVLEAIAPTGTTTTVGGGSKVNAKIVGPIAAAGALVLIIGAAVLYRQKRGAVPDDGTLDKKFHSNRDGSLEDSTVVMDGSCYNSVASRTRRNTNGTAEFGDTAEEHDDNATQGSGNFSLSTHLPTIGENDDDSTNDDHHQPIQGSQQRDVVSPCTTDEMSLSEVPLFEESDDEL